MEKRDRKLLQIIIFAGIAIGNYIQAIRYLSKWDTIGGGLFLATAIALSAGAFGYWIDRRKDNGP